jgi:N-acetylmuramoyl-L-alanine amidase
VPLRAIGRIAPLVAAAVAVLVWPAAPAANLAPPPPVRKPPIHWDPIPFGAARKAQMRAYAERHYGLRTPKLVDPHVIVLHYTDSPDFQSTYNTFAPDTPDPELHELPNDCAHYVIDRDGTIHQLVSINIMCRHTVGLNWTAIGIEHVGYSDAQVLDDHRELRASLALVRWLRCRFHIEIANVIGHAESLTSPYHHERVASLRRQTHGDFQHADARTYRTRLRALGGCPKAAIPPGNPGAVVSTSATSATQLRDEKGRNTRPFSSRRLEGRPVRAQLRHRHHPRRWCRPLGPARRRAP